MWREAPWPTYVSDNGSHRADVAHLRRAAIFGRLDDDILDALAALARGRSYEITEPDSRSPAVYLVAVGSLRLVRSSPSGDEVTLLRLRADDAFDLGSLDRDGHPKTVALIHDGGIVVYGLPPALLIISSQANWVGLRTMLCKLRQIQVTGEAHRREEAPCIAMAAQADTIFAGPDLPGLPVVPLVCELREISPTSRIVVLGEPLYCMDHAYLARLGTTNVVRWWDVTERTVPIIVEAVCADLYVTSLIATDQPALPSRGRASGMGNGAVACQRRARPCALR